MIAVMKLAGTAFASACLGCAVLGTPILVAQGEGTAPHLAAAQAAADRPEHLRLFNALCVAPPAPPAQAAAPPVGAPQGPPPRERWHAEPAKVFDNLYLVGQTEYTAWAVVTSEGIIVIDPLFDYSVEDEVWNGLTKLGFDPKRIRYVVISHAHGDHVGGARFLQDRGARIVMSAADWDLLAADPAPWPKAKRDIVATDGQQLTLGDTTLTLHFTPGHTLGTISTIIPVKDGGRTHTAALWGGTGFNWRGNGGATATSRRSDRRASGTTRTAIRRASSARLPPRPARTCSCRTIPGPTPPRRNYPHCSAGRPASRIPTS